MVAFKHSTQKNDLNNEEDKNKRNFPSKQLASLCSVQKNIFAAKKKGLKNCANQWQS